MSLYNLLFGMNSQTELLLAVLGLRKNDVERLRNVFASADGKTIEICTRTGGGNREDYPNLVMRKLPTWAGSADDDFDSTYCTDTFNVPDEWTQDVTNLSDVLTHGLRGEFARHLSATLRREPTESDMATAAYEAEQAALARTAHCMANGHTFVPKDDHAMKTAMELAEKNAGKLRSCWGIMPLALTVKRDFFPYPKAVDENTRRSFVRVDVNYDYAWKIDDAYWQHCQDRWANEFPLTMARISESVDRHRSRAA